MGALDGVRVVDLTRIIAGPFCTMLLADMGADVIKVEPREGGDPVRAQGAIKDGLSYYFAQFNRNKRSLAIDLYPEDGKAVLADLIAQADVLAENFRPGVLARMGFDAERLKDLNPNLVVASVNGYGSNGPYVDRPAFDFIAQAMSGFMAVNGAPDQPPMRAAPPIADLVAGLYAAFGVACALVSRGKGGTGQSVESSLVNGLVSMLGYLSAETLATGRNPARTGNDHPIVAPYGLFRAADGDVAIAPSTDLYVSRLMNALGLAHLLHEPDFASNAARVQNRTRLNAIIDETIGRKTVDHWIATVNAAGVPCGRVMNLDQVFQDPQILAQEMVLEVDQPGHGTARFTGFPVKLSATPCTVRHPVPGHGEHTEEILRALGYDRARIDALRDRGIV